MEERSIGVWQWFHALTQTHESCLLGRQGGLRVRASLGTVNNLLVTVYIPVLSAVRKMEKY
jgi:hypothetical protein